MIMPELRKRIRVNTTRGALGEAKNTPANFPGRVITILLAALALALDPGLSGAGSFGPTQCQMQIENDAFIPCGETFMVQLGLGMSLEDYKGQTLPSDGEVIDLFDENHSFRSKNGLLEVTFNLMSGTGSVGSNCLSLFCSTEAGRRWSLIWIRMVSPGSAISVGPGNLPL